jgi:hypothetical protein
MPASRLLTRRSNGVLTEVLVRPGPTRSIAATKECAGAGASSSIPGRASASRSPTREAGDTLVVFVQFHGVGTGSRVELTVPFVELTVPFVHLGNYRNRELLRFSAYADRAEALETAGLRE